MKKEFIICLPWKIEGDKFYFFAEDYARAKEMLEGWLNDLQDICEHKTYQRGKCQNCQLPCEHDIDKNICLICGEWQEPGDPRMEPEWREER